MARKLDGARELLARANRMIANEGVLDAFGHVTMRHPDDPQRYLMSRSRAPELVQPEDVLEFTLELAAGETERCTTLWRTCIHGGIYQARPDVNAVCHHHASSILPFCISGMELKPVFHLGATLGEKVPDFDCVDAMPVRTLAARQQEQNGGGGGPTFDLPGIAKSFAVMAALRMRLELERADYLGGGRRWTQRHKICVFTFKK